ncbi:50S ribosomal protein L29 [Williamsoniiplasma somnilux]|uniref:Large ribosomal subunit protein uL29 n=1 Tax=Williamsoniiplasma somnilux TaxID=215578 RepID=A0A2K8P0U8_9MOLU|nr:50S ribosomal protein L29 [Williamsoniiplasma somnilux]ATZ18523.1 50S ribosomal protein L29 [Williamsoniiplasma somnilux]
MPKKNPITDLKAKSVDELIQLGETKRAELFALKFQAAVGSLEKTHHIPTIRKEIARIELVLGEKRRAGENTNKTIKANYNEAVANAEQSGKAVREKHRKMIEEMQAEQFGGVDADAMAAAMANGDNAIEGENK